MMKIEEKISRIETIVIQQKIILSKLDITNLLETAIKIRSLELQKDMVIAIPTKKML